MSKNAKASLAHRGVWGNLLLPFGFVLAFLMIPPVAIGFGIIAIVIAMATAPYIQIADVGGRFIVSMLCSSVELYLILVMIVGIIFWLGSRKRR